MKYNLHRLDVHGEASSEKMALGVALDGYVSAVVGTHTHVPTADHQILENGTHEDLLKNSKIYKNFYEKQLKKN